MLDIKWIRTNPDLLDQELVNRGMIPISDKILELDAASRETTTLIQELRHARKMLSNQIRYVKSEEGEGNYEKLKNNVEHINQKIRELSSLTHEEELSTLLDSLPNITAEDVPNGSDESMNQLIRSWGEISHIENPLHHYEIGENLGMMDFRCAAKMSGNRFVILKHDLAKLERALINFMLDVHTEEFNFSEISPPSLVRSKAMYNVGQLPKFADASFEVVGGYRLIPTGEVPLTNIFSDTISSREIFPARFVAFTPCFRSEAGAAGKDTRGMIRMHQFSKVELVTITTPDDSEAEHEYLTNAAEEILRKLNLPYRVMLLCKGDTGFASKKTYDLEVWLPAQGCYREISSCSHFGDFQARRMKSRYREFNERETKFLHTINGSGLAVGRTIVAILENYQNSDGSVRIPPILQNYMGGQTIIAAREESMIS